MTMKLPPGVSLPGIDPGGVISTIEPAEPIISEDEESQQNDTTGVLYWLNEQCITRYS